MSASDQSSAEKIADYYDDTLVDYDAWSREGYLHFGYWRPWLNPFLRRPMLEEMNRLIFKHLHLNQLEPGCGVADLGCGVGAVSRHGSELYPDLQFHAMTLSPSQVDEAKQRHNAKCQEMRSDGKLSVNYYCGDYHKIPLEDDTLSGAFYLESLCHSRRPDEALAESARVVKQGGRIVLTDGFITRPIDKTSSLFQHTVKSVAHNWAVPMFHEIELGRKWTGAGKLKLVEEFECGWRLGPSALHAAHLSFFHFFKLLIKQRKVTKWQWRHLTASAYTIALGLYRKYFRYHLLAWEKV